MHTLDNPAWHALTGPQQTVAEGGSLARRYDPDMTPFAALPDDPSSEAWEALRDLVGPGGVAVLFRTAIVAPSGWEELFSFPTVQMIATGESATPGPGSEELGLEAVPEMLELVEAAQPGPFGPRTIELGTYIGLRVDGALVAMAGERMRLPGHTEISAVCTAPNHRSRGLASTVVRDLGSRITARGDTPILHVMETNETAIRLYRALEFTPRQKFTVVGLRAPG